MTHNIDNYDDHQPQSVRVELPHNIDDKIGKLLYEYSVWRDYYLSVLSEKAITKKDWVRIRDDIQEKARNDIKALISAEVKKARTEELELLHYANWGTDDMNALIDPLIDDYIFNRGEELKRGQDE